MKNLLIVLTILTTAFFAKAQNPQININANITNMGEWGRNPNLLKVAINTNFPTTINGIIEVTLDLEEIGDVFHAHSNPVNFQQGNFNLNFCNVDIANQWNQNFNPQMEQQIQQNQGNLLDGPYSLKVQIINAQNNQVIAQKLAQFEVKLGGGVSNTDCEKIKKEFESLVQQVKVIQKNCDDIEAEIQKTENEITNTETAITNATNALNKMKADKKAAESNLRNAQALLNSLKPHGTVTAKKNAKKGSNYVGYGGHVIVFENADALSGAMKKMNNSGNSVSDVFKNYVAAQKAIKKLGKQIPKQQQKITGLNTKLKNLKTKLQQLKASLEACKNNKTKAEELGKKAKELEEKCKIKVVEITKIQQLIDKEKARMARLNRAAKNAERRKKLAQKTANGHYDTNTEQNKINQADTDRKAGQSATRNANSKLNQAQRALQQGDTEKAKKLLEEAKEERRKAEEKFRNYSQAVNEITTGITRTKYKKECIDEEFQPIITKHSFFRIARIDEVSYVPVGYDSEEAYKMKLDDGHKLLTKLNALSAISNFTSVKGVVTWGASTAIEKGTELAMGGGVGPHEILDTYATIIIKGKQKLHVTVTGYNMTITYETVCENGKKVKRIKETKISKPFSHTIKYDKPGELLLGTKEQRARQVAKLLNQMNQKSGRNGFSVVK